MAPCAFRLAVAGAHEQMKSGVRLAVAGFPAGGEPAVDIGLRHGDRVLPGGIYRVVLGGDVVHGFATTLPPRRCRNLLGRGGDARLHHDVATEITFVHAPREPRAIEELAARFLVEEIAAELRGGRA